MWCPYWFIEFCLPMNGRKRLVRVVWEGWAAPWVRRRWGSSMARTCTCAVVANTAVAVADRGEGTVSICPSSAIPPCR